MVCVLYAYIWVACMARPPGPSPTHQSPPQLATPTSIYLLASWTMAWPWPSIDRFVDVPMLRSESTTYTESWYLPRGPSFWLFPPGPRLMLPFACLHACTGCWAHWNRRADRAFFPLLTAVAWRPLLCGRAARLLHDACQDAGTTATTARLRRAIYIRHCCTHVGCDASTTLVVSWRAYTRSEHAYVRTATIHMHMHACI